MANELLATADEKFEKMGVGIQAIQNQVAGIIEQVKFPNREAYLEADRILAEVNRAFNHVEAERKELTKPLDLVKDKIMESAKRWTDPLKAIKERLRAVMGRYAADEENWAIGERRKREAEERKKKEDERLELASIAEKNGMAKTADAIIEKPISVRPQIVETANDQAKSTRRKKYRATVVDGKAFLGGIIAGTIPISTIEIKTARLDTFANQAEGKLEWPGIQITEEYVIGSGR
jgi:hypothetical protein